MDTATLAFPAPAHPEWLTTPGPVRSGLSLRVAETSDLPFLRELYAASRAGELACVPWPHAAKRSFCDSQFMLQHRHYVAHCVPALFLLVEHEGRPAGRLYLHWTPEEMRIVDILLDEAVRGCGFGSALLRWVQAAALAARVEVLTLHVEQRNQGACRLYRRLGFQGRSVEGTHLRMAWSPQAATALS